MADDFAPRARGESSIEVLGVKETLKALRELDPQLRRQFDRDIKAVVAPMVSAAKGSYPSRPGWDILSGMARNWSQGGSRKFPWNVSAVRAGVKVKTSARRNANSVVYISQANAAGAIFEVAGTGNEFGANLRARHAPVLWPTYDRYAAEIEAGVADIVREAEKIVEQRMSSWR